MGKTYYESKAEELLAKRGEQEQPRSLIRDFAEWLEAERDSGYLAGLDFAERRMRDFRRDMVDVENKLREAAKTGCRCPFMFTSGERCTGRLQHEGGHYTNGVVP